MYQNVTSWDSFEPALTKAGQADIVLTFGVAPSTSPEWYGFEAARVTQKRWVFELCSSQKEAGSRHGGVASATEQQLFLKAALEVRAAERQALDGLGLEANAAHGERLL